jgi:hypothetical protein
MMIVAQPNNEINFPKNVKFALHSRMLLRSRQKRAEIHFFVCVLCAQCKCSKIAIFGRANRTYLIFEIDTREIDSSDG